MILHFHLVNLIVKSVVASLNLYEISVPQKLYIWGVARDEKNKRFAGFLVASDFEKEKFVHFVSFKS